MGHLKQQNMSYVAHFSFAMKLALQMVLLAIVSVVHAFFPFILPDTVSHSIKEMDGKLQELANAN
ncbi:MAG: hypothetical protein CL753_06920 [Chloroflexi bacterium]|jgi:hypothetical protein|nr:hypothetical protein [Chloroflexota bacterium]